MDENDFWRLVSISLHMYFLHVQRQQSDINYTEAAMVGAVKGCCDGQFY